MKKRLAHSHAKYETQPTAAERETTDHITVGKVRQWPVCKIPKKAKNVVGPNPQDRTDHRSLSIFRPEDAFWGLF
jgi:hypothetical protein